MHSRPELVTERDHTSGPNARDRYTDFISIFAKRGSNIFNEREPSSHVIASAARQSIAAKLAAPRYYPERVRAGGS